MEAKCLSMCPQSEVQFRNANGLVHILETDAEFDEVQSSSYSTNRNRQRNRHREGNPLKMVKEFTRSAAGKARASADEIRPYSVLMDTIRYLLSLLDKYPSSNSWPVVYEFVSDRLRAVRQDMIIQHLDAESSINVLEAMIPFYIEAEHRCELTKCPSYDRKLHITQLEECFCRWKEIDDAFAVADEKIMQCYLLRFANRTWSLVLLSKWSLRLSRTSAQLLWDIILSIRMGNFVRFFRLLDSIGDLILRFALHPHLAQMRYQALCACTIAYKCKDLTLPEEYLCNSLNMGPLQLRRCFLELGIKVSITSCLTMII